MTDSDDESIKPDSSNEESGAISVLFNMGDIPYMVGELSKLSTNVKDKLVTNGLVCRAWNTHNVLGGTIFFRKMVKVVDQMKK